MTEPHHAIYEAHYSRNMLQLLAGKGWRRFVALRIDPKGLTLGGVPARHRSHTGFVPWEDLTSVVLWRAYTMGAKFFTPDTRDYIGVRLRPGAPIPHGPNRELSQKWSTRTAPHMEYEIVRTSHPVIFWNLEKERICAAVEAFAPGIQVEDLRDTR
ncbi:hypothetical protein RKE29_11625 [Streptomyces sp. B1866]|uniref:hypothetical protein n=1 Tax=Streptomyces sp. B1866 TaxID=3075431 RepID=UPI00288CFB76|nr:hypothetical protein [Streptomyces sp. B1866]MDT3397288.1 hypothetical protein [Streptomyces sp. B1866]